MTDYDEINKIWARHEAVTNMGIRIVGDLGRQAHIDRATLLDAVDRLTAENERLRDVVAKMVRFTGSMQGCYASDSANDAVEWVSDRIRKLADGKSIPELENDDD